MVIAPVPWDAEEAYTANGVTYTVHPIAGLFPVMPDQEFELLVKDLKTHGLRRPILVTGPGATVIVDGRHRLRAALEAGVKPVFEQLPDDVNPLAVIYTENLRRRQMTQGQLAILGALIRRVAPQIDPTAGNCGPVRLPFGDPALAALAAAAAVEGGGDEDDVRPTGALARQPTQEEIAADLAISVPYLRRAERVVQYAPDLAMQVWSGQLQLNDAYDRCREQARDAGEIRQGSAKATGKRTAQRTGQRRHSEEPSASRNSMEIESTAGNLPATEAVSADENGASPPMPPPLGDESLQPVPTSPTAEEKMRADEGGRSQELATPPLVLAGLRLTLGDIDLDPCSTEAAQERIGATEWYSLRQDGLSRPWHGTVHVFPPIEHVDRFAAKLAIELASGRVQRAAFLGPADLRSDWAQHLLQQSAFDALVIERDRRSSGAAGNRNPQMGRLALFLLGVDSDRLFEAFRTWGLTLCSPRSNANHGAQANAAGTLPEDRIPQADRSTTSSTNPSPPPYPKSDAKALGLTDEEDGRSASDETGNRLARVDHRQAPGAEPEVTERGIGPEIAAGGGTHPEKKWSPGTLLKKAKASKLGTAARTLRDRVSKTRARLGGVETSRGTDGGSSAPTDAASKDEN